MLSWVIKKSNLGHLQIVTEPVPFKLSVNLYFPLIFLPFFLIVVAAVVVKQAVKTLVCFVGLFCWVGVFGFFSFLVAFWKPLLYWDV